MVMDGREGMGYDGWIGAVDGLSATRRSDNIFWIVMDLNRMHTLPMCSALISLSYNE